MSALDKSIIDLVAEMRLIVTRGMTIGHFIPGMPYVYATPMMVLHMEMAAGSAIESRLPTGFVSVGMEVNVRHLATTPIGSAVRTIARVTGTDAKSVFFNIEAWNSVRKIGEGTHRRGIVNVRDFEQRFSKESALS
jgi:fluoroacetyl-CoA thioesterase